jgi:2'-5' RNA ligase
MIKMLDVITEDYKHRYGCVMLFFNFPYLNKIQDAINPDDLYEESDDDSFGLEPSAHVTLLFGLHKEVSNEDVKQSLKDIIFDDCKLFNLSFFENEKYDVLNFEVGYATRGGAFLSKANKELKKLPYTSEFPDYNPHMTIAYLKPGMGKKYVDKLKRLDDYTLTPKECIYSKTDKSKVKIKINLRK